ncbi:hypothetical protein FKX85_20900 [Echinicola soli]|uniref:Response regulatory domain-containing protein n=1 Tax=Echinicola soli TaxID=2591634 RepID=A0A514CNF9_9BACT|nr:hypothetical protein [Echinicola soli]QDH81355.1 hypothetical protein FKX85_20900 [Echinicola soli]
MYRSGKPCNYFIIENDPEVRAKIQKSLSQARFTCLGNTGTSTQVGKRLNDCSPSPDIIMVGLYKETTHIVNYVGSKFPKASIILIVKTGESFEDELLSKQKVNYISI